MRKFIITETQLQNIATITLKVPTEFGPGILNILNSLQELVDPVPTEVAPKEEL